MLLVPAGGAVELPRRVASTAAPRRADPVHCRAGRGGRAGCWRRLRAGTATTRSWPAAARGRRRRGAVGPPERRARPSPRRCPDLRTRRREWSARWPAWRAAGDGTWTTPLRPCQPLRPVPLIGEGRFSPRHAPAKRPALGGATWAGRAEVLVDDLELEAEEQAPRRAARAVPVRRLSPTLPGLRTGSFGLWAEGALIPAIATPTVLAPLEPRASTRGPRGCADGFGRRAALRPSGVVELSGSARTRGPRVLRRLLSPAGPRRDGRRWRSSSPPRRRVPLHGPVKRLEILTVAPSLRSAPPVARSLRLLLRFRCLRARRHGVPHFAPVPFGTLLGRARLRSVAWMR